MNAIDSLALGLGGVLCGLGILTAVTGWRAESRVRPEGEFLKIGGARVHLVDRGRGPAIFMVHGLGGQSRHFTFALAPKLTDRYRVVVIDRPGSGYSKWTARTDSTLAAQGALVAAIIAHLGLERPLLVGHSYGAAVALATALDHPSAVGGLALIAPLTHPEHRKHHSRRRLDIQSPWAQKILASTLAVPLAAMFGARTESEIFSPEPVPAEFSGRGGGTLMHRRSAILGAMQDVRALSGQLANMVNGYQDLVIPCDILAAQSDVLLDPIEQCVSMKALMPQLRLREVAGGHMLPMTQPDLVADWLAEIAAPIHHIDG